MLIETLQNKGKEFLVLFVDGETEDEIKLLAQERTVSQFI